MSLPTTRVDLFAEDRAHEEFLRAAVRRIARESGRQVEISVVSAKGGHAVVLSELRAYRGLVECGLRPIPNLLVVGIDGNGKKYLKTKRDVEQELAGTNCAPHVAIACPNPHIERWYFADQGSFKAVVGKVPTIRKRSAGRDYYKKLLAQVVIDAGHAPTLGGIEYATELVDGMDIYLAGKADAALKHFFEELRAGFKG